MANFSDLPEEQFRLSMKPHAVEIYEELWPGCEVKDFRGIGKGAHVLDKYFGVDSAIVMRSGQQLLLQEKYRRNDALSNPDMRIDPECPDFTQELFNGWNTPNESHGEFFNLAAQIYFYGWASADDSSFEEWYILDVAKYKLLVEKVGDEIRNSKSPEQHALMTFSKIGKQYQNGTCGKALFSAIPINRLSDAVLFSHHNTTTKGMQQKVLGPW